MKTSTARVKTVKKAATLANTRGMKHHELWILYRLLHLFHGNDIFFISFIEQGSNYRELQLRTGQQSKNAKPCHFVTVVINGKLAIVV